MPSILVNDTLSSLSSGVSQQYEEGRFDSQVSELKNCMPSLPRGLLRRNPLEAVATLSTVPVDLTTSYTYTYDRGTGDEQYLVVVPGDGCLFVFNTNENTGVPIYTTTENAYLTLPVGAIAKHSFGSLTIGDHTFIVNKTKQVSFTTDVASSVGWEDKAFYWIKKTASVTTAQYQNTSGEVGTLQQGYEYILNNLKIIGTSDSRPNQTAIDLNSSPLIAAEFAANSVNSLVNKAEGSICYNDSFTGNDWRWEDSFGNDASRGVWKTVESSSELPAQLPTDLDGFIVQVTGGTSNIIDDYYLQYDDASKTWIETVKPGALTTLDEDTMPHVLYRLSGGFEFNTYQDISTDGSSLLGTSRWEKRQSGGSDEIEDPSFVNKEISFITFHKNRLCFLTSDSFVLSQTGLYGNFFKQTVQEDLDDDPIDLAVASTDVTILRSAVPTAGQLVLFSDDTQLSLVSTGGPLTSLTADIVPLSSYTYGSKAEAKAIGNKIFFTNQAGGYSQLYSYQITDQGSQLTEGTLMTVHLPTYIDSSASRIIGHDVLGYTFIEQEENPKELVVLTSFYKGREELQNAFHKWTFAKNIVSTHIIKNDLYVLFSDGDFTKMSLEIPGDTTIVEYLDSYNTTTEANQSYVSEVVFSQFYYRDGEGKGTERGRFQLRTMLYTILEGSKYVTNIFSTDQLALVPDNIFGPAWKDSEGWADENSWYDVTPLYTRQYINDEKITVMSNSSKVNIAFRSSEEEPSKGFELATVNIEGMFHQRSRRT